MTIDPEPHTSAQPGADTPALRPGDPERAREQGRTHRILCAHADQDGRSMHWLEPDEICLRGIDDARLSHLGDLAAAMAADPSRAGEVVSQMVLGGASTTDVRLVIGTGSFWAWRRCASPPTGDRPVPYLLTAEGLRAAEAADREAGQ